MSAPNRQPDPLIGQHLLTFGVGRQTSRHCRWRAGSRPDFGQRHQFHPFDRQGNRLAARHPVFAGLRIKIRDFDGRNLFYVGIERTDRSREHKSIVGSLSLVRLVGQFETLAQGSLFPQIELFHGFRRQASRTDHDRQGHRISDPDCLRRRSRS